MLTKSDFLRFLDAPMHLWAEKNNQLEDPTPSLFDLHLMEQGKEIEKLAKQFLQEHFSSQGTQFEIEEEKTFTDGRYQTRVDVLVFDSADQVYDIYEIKSSTSFKKVHKYDLAFQWLVCESEIPIRNLYAVYINKEYVRDGEIDDHQLFVIENVTEKVVKVKDEVSSAREGAWKVLTQVSPDTVEECVKPNTCPSPKLCHPNLPEYPIYDLSRLGAKKARDLKSNGILSILDIPDNYPLSDKQNRQVEVVRSGKPGINQTAIQKEMAKLEYPLNFLDYETYNPGVPYYDGYKPYQHMVFQYSLHVFETPNSEPEHFEFLMTDKADPGIKLVEHLSKHLRPSGSVIVWYRPFEATRNSEMAERYPEYSDFLLNVNERIYDLMDVFKKGYYIHPDFHGSTSIKNVLPVLVQDHEITYDDLPIPKGDEAMMAWVGIMSGIKPQDEVEQIKQDLLRYCEMDTLAMVKNWQALTSLVSG